jgi:hypothetical protein
MHCTVPKHTGLHTALKLYRNEALHVDTIAKAPLSVITLNSDGLLVQQRRVNKQGGCGIFRSQIILQWTEANWLLWSTYKSHLVPSKGRDSSVTIVIRAGRSGDRISVRDEIFRTRPDRSWGLPNLLNNGYRVFDWLYFEFGTSQPRWT